ncbi:MAG: tetratricopeptide repeat protein [Candidatus Kapabacteria bacterium]|nr:tetratricopeptide repeat protein [Candidatus Kapabacteria bacterium]
MLWFGLLFLSFHFPALSQKPALPLRPPSADSLEKILAQSLPDTVRVKILIELARALWATNLQESRKYATDALTIANLMDYKKGRANALNTIGVTYYYQGWYDIALGYHKQALEIRKSINDTSGIGHSTNNIGIIYLGQRKNREALNYLFEALEIYKTVKLRSSIAVAYNNIGTIYRREKKLDSAALMHRAALDVLKGANNLTGEALSYNSMGGVMEDLGVYDDALRFQREAYKLYSDVTNHKGMVNALTGEASALFKLKRYPEALTQIRTALDLASSMNSRPELRDCYELLARIEEGIGNFSGALQNYKRYEALKDSLLSEEASSRTAEFSAQYDSERKAKQIELLTAQRKGQQIQRNLLITIIFASFIAVGLVYVRYRTKQRSEAALQDANVQLQEKNALITEARSTVEALLLNVLPKPIAERMQAGERRIAENFSDVTVLFADIVDFTHLAAGLPPEELVAFLDAIFSDFDALAERHNLEKIKTIGDAYMAVCGIPEPNPHHCLNVALFALDMLRVIERYNIHPEATSPLQVRIGIHTGSVVAGVIGKKKFSYDLWGDTVNIASRLESHGQAGAILCSSEVYDILKESCIFEQCGETALKGNITLTTYFLRSVKQQS